MGSASHLYPSLVPLLSTLSPSSLPSFPPFLYLLPGKQGLPPGILPGKI